MKCQLSTWKTTCIFSIFLLHLCHIGSVSNRYVLSHNVAKSTGFYRAPSHYSKENPLPSFIITSRPMSFHSDPYNTQKGHSLKSPLIQTKNKAALTSVPGVATVVCRGISCANSAMSFSDWPSESEDDGFPGEAIPVDESEYMTAMVGQHQPEITAKVTSAPKVKQGHTQSKVHLLTNRPYLRRGSTKQKTPAPTRKTYIQQRSTTIAAIPSTTTRRRPVAQSQVSTTTTKPLASNIRPTFVFQRPSFVFPAMAAFSLMALPVAAAAVPLLLNGRRKRRSLWADLPSHSSLQDPSASPELDLMELWSSLENLEKGFESMEWAAGLGHREKVTKARKSMEKMKDKVMRQKY